MTVAEVVEKLSSANRGWLDMNRDVLVKAREGKLERLEYERSASICAYLRCLADCGIITDAEFRRLLSWYRR